MITTDAERALGTPPTYVDHARPQDLLICDAASSTAALAANVPMRPLISELKKVPK